MPGDLVGSGSALACTRTVPGGERRGWLALRALRCRLPCRGGSRVANQDPAVEGAQRILTRLDEELLTNFKASLPLYRHVYEHGTKRLLGTGSLLAVADEMFLVSAAHVLREIQRDAGAELFIGHYKVAKLVGASGQVSSSDGSADVAAVRLNTALHPILAHAKILRVSDLASNPDPEPQMLCVAGFPLERNPGEPTTPNAVIYTSHAPVDVPVALKDYDSRINGLFAIDHNEPIASDSEQPWLPDSFGGMSGSPVWAIPLDIDPSQPFAIFAKVVGVQTGVYPKDKGQQLAKYTRIKIVLALIAQLCPDLLPALALSLPTPRR